MTDQSQTKLIDWLSLSRGHINILQHYDQAKTMEMISIGRI